MRGRDFWFYISVPENWAQSHFPKVTGAILTRAERMTNARRDTSPVEWPRRCPVLPLFAKKRLLSKAHQAAAASLHPEEAFLPGPGSGHTRRSAAALSRRKAPAASPLPTAPSKCCPEARRVRDLLANLLRPAVGSEGWKRLVVVVFFPLTRSFPVFSSDPLEPSAPVLEPSW